MNEPFTVIDLLIVLIEALQDVSALMHCQRIILNMSSVDRPDETEVISAPQVCNEALTRFVKSN